MAEEKRITISRSLNGDTIYYIARNSSGVVFARALTLKELEAAIKTYKEPPLAEEEGEDQGKGVSVKGEEAEKKDKKFLTNNLLGEVQRRKQEQEQVEQVITEATTAEESEEEDEQSSPADNKFLENDLKTKVEERKEQSKKKSFWDKLK